MKYYIKKIESMSIKVCDFIASNSLFTRDFYALAVKYPMKLIPITAIDAPELQIYHQFREHAFKEDGSFVADSPKVVNLLLEEAIQVQSILATQEYYDKTQSLISKHPQAQLYLASKEQMQNIVGHKIHHNVMMHGIRPQETALDQLGDQIIMLDEISSTQNIGAIARSAAAIGIPSYLVPLRGPHPYSRRALRVSMGHVAMLDIHCYDSITDTIMILKSNGYRIYAAEVSADSTALSEVKVAEKWVILMGHEGTGLSEEVMALCDEIVTIEMVEGVKSFNVGIAASLMMYTFKHSKN